jgi:hypothetical protein
VNWWVRNFCPIRQQVVLHDILVWGGDELENWSLRVTVG